MANLAKRREFELASSVEQSRPALRIGDDLPRRSAWRLLNGEGLLVLVVVAVAWETASHFLPPFLFPSIEKVAHATANILADPMAFSSIEETYLRILGFLALGFVLGSVLGAGAGANRRLERMLVPVIQLKQGIPGICWIIFATLWFRDMDWRIGFVIVISTLPSFFYQVRDGFRAIPAELWDMVRSWRPTSWQMLRKLVLPGLMPAILIALRINLGAATRVTIMAELLAGNNGIGYFLRNAEEQFRMDVAMAWTVVLVVFVISTDLAMAYLEKYLLRWRQQAERGA